MLQTLSAALLPIMLVTSLLNNTNNDVTENSYKNEVVFELEERLPTSPNTTATLYPKRTKTATYRWSSNLITTNTFQKSNTKYLLITNPNRRSPRLKYCSGERQNASEERLKPTVKHMKRCSALTRQTASCFSSIRQLSIIYLTVCL